MNTWTAYGLVALGGAFGAMARMFVTTWMQGRVPGAAFPWGTFLINISGSLILGFFAALIIERVIVSPAFRPLVTIGFVGAYTTFSTFEYESFQLGWSWQAFGNVVGSVVVGYLCVWGGTRLALQLAAALHHGAAQ